MNIEDLIVTLLSISFLYPVLFLIMDSLTGGKIGLKIFYIGFAVLTALPILYFLTEGK